MMRSRKWMVLCAAVLLAPAMAFAAADDDRVMGYYEGSFTGDSGALKSIYARVAGLSETSWKAVFYIAGADGVETRTEVEGKAEARRKPANFDGTIDLGALGGNTAVKGVIEKRTFEGTLTPEGGQPVAFTLKRVTKESPTLGAPAPEGAIVLFDGTSTDKWRRDPETWCVQPDGSMQVCGSSLRTRDEFGSGTYHVEFKTPYQPNEREQGRGNSGVYLLGRYEVQVLDNFGWEPKWDFCGGIYKVAVPLKDATLPPLTWQTYDITFTAAKFDTNGNKMDNARITVVHNGITVHDNLELPHPTPGGVSGEDGATGPLLLQDHRNEVSYRNIWFKPAE
jgi:hypothetical protein